MKKVDGMTGQLLAKPTKNLVLHLDSLGAIRPFLSLLYKPSEVVKTQTIRVTGRYMEQVRRSIWLVVDAHRG